MLSLFDERGAWPSQLTSWTTSLLKIPPQQKKIHSSTTVVYYYKPPASFLNETQQDFSKVGRTEGVPWAYRWQRCQVYPYIGDGETAGYNAIRNMSCEPIEAYTLVPPNPRQMTEMPPSASYLGLIQEGAKLWKFDRAYREQLNKGEAASNLLVKEGVSEMALRLAERASGIDRTYKIRVTSKRI